MKINWTKDAIITGALAIVVILIAGWFASQQSLKNKGSFVLPVPFTTQAPNGSWAGNENCEEASVVMANAYIRGNTQDTLVAKTALEEMAVLNAWEIKNLGHSQDNSAEETAQMAKAIYGLRTKILNNFTVEDLKKELVKNRVILLPLRGRLLKNSGYLQPGPLYHMILIRGYNTEGFITNDPGTEKGKNKIYSYENILEAAADWDSAQNSIDPTKKVALIIY